MQSLGKKWNSSKDFNFTSNEGTCWFLKGRNKVNCYQLFQEGCNQMESAVIANSNYSFKELQKKIIRVKISWSINFARTCYCWENSKFRWCCYSNRSYIAESEIIELCLSQQTEVEEEENNDDHENSIVGSFYQRKGKPSRLKV